MVVNAQIYWCGDCCSATGLKINDKFKSLTLLQVAPCDTNRKIGPYTLIANFIAVNAKNIGLNEYEGHSLFDIIFGNNTDIDIDMVTGDNHSLNQLNFVILDAIGVDYVPSIKNIKEAANNLFSFKSNDKHTGIIRAKGVIDVISRTLTA